MLNKDLLDIIKLLEGDIPDFEHVHPNLQESIARWIADDRKYLVLTRKTKLRRKTRVKS